MCVLWESCRLSFHVLPRLRDEPRGAPERFPPPLFRHPAALGAHRLVGVRAPGNRFQIAHIALMVEPAARSPTAPFDRL